MTHHGLRPPAHAVRREGLVRDVLHDRDGALAHERDAHRMGAHAVARDTASGLGGAQAAGNELTVGGPVPRGLDTASRFIEGDIKKDP